MAEGETTKKHRALSPEKLNAAVVTVSDSKFDYIWKRKLDESYSGEIKDETDDISGRLLIDGIEKAGNEVVFYSIIPDHKELIKALVDFIVERYSPDFIVTTGGTGISPRDVTIEAIMELYDKNLEGFGEYFRARSFEDIGSAALLSRAGAGVYNGCLIFSLPGSPNACKLGMKIITREASHLVKHVRE